MCPRKYVSQSTGFMDRNLFEKIILAMKHKEIEAVVPFFRGESLLHPYFAEMMAQLRENTSAEIQLATNALLLDKQLIRHLIELEIDFISFSLDAFKKQTYEKIRRGGDFDLAVNNVKEFLKQRKDNPHNKTVVQVSATENKDNKSELSEFIQYWKGRADRVRIYPCHSEGGRFGELPQSRHRKELALRGPCKKPFADFVIYYDGRVALCNHDWDRNGDRSLGSLNDQSIMEIWNGKPYEHVRERHLDRLWCELSPCAHCDHWIGADGTTTCIGELYT